MTDAFLVLFANYRPTRRKRKETKKKKKRKEKKIKLEMDRIRSFQSINDWKGRHFEIANACLTTNSTTLNFFCFLNFYF